MTVNFQDLQKQIPIQWRVQSYKDTQKGGRAICIAYIDARDVMDALDEVCGPENWSDEYSRIGDRLVCTLKIRVNGEWISKSDVGTETSTESEKGEFSDALKRAAVKWGIGRFLYALDPVWVRAAVKKVEKNGRTFINGNVVTKEGEIIWDLTDYINSKKYINDIKS